VTVASGGTGLAVTEALADERVRVVGAARTISPKLEQATVAAVVAAANGFGDEEFLAAIPEQAGIASRRITGPEGGCRAHHVPRLRRGGQHRRRGRRHRRRTLKTS
jgi:NAD(P)-dependent dehydrogenase (short-subunit alcohol dehydrogenase family)